MTTNHVCTEEKRMKDENSRPLKYSHEGSMGMLLDTRHYLITANGKRLLDISPDISHARRLAADAIKNGGEAVIYVSIEAWKDVGATLEQVILKDWP